MNTGLVFLITIFVTSVLLIQFILLGEELVFAKDTLGEIIHDPLKHALAGCRWCILVWSVKFVKSST